jgi:hypothetical protein
MMSSQPTTLNPASCGAQADEVDASDPPQDRASLLMEWTRVMGCPPPPHLSVRIMRQALSYEDQCARLGGLSKAAQNHLEGVLRELQAKRTSICPSRGPIARTSGKAAGATLGASEKDSASKLAGTGGTEFDRVHDVNPDAVASPTRQVRIPSRATTLSAGTVLVREWNGRPYQVLVVQRGSDLAFEMDGKRYKSLSAIARQITGARWSGPRFFGLTKDVHVPKPGRADGSARSAEASGA